jgi:hypothetical protein
MEVSQSEDFDRRCSGFVGLPSKSNLHRSTGVAVFCYKTRCLGDN